MAQDSIAYVLIRDCNCSNCCNPSHLTEVVDYKVNTNDKSETEIICNTLILIVWIIVGTIILATIISAAKSLFESRIKRTLEIKKDQLRILKAKEDEMKRNEDENKQLKTK